MPGPLCYVLRLNTSTSKNLLLYHRKCLQCPEGKGTAGGSAALENPMEDGFSQLDETSKDSESSPLDDTDFAFPQLLDSSSDGTLRP